MADSVNPGHFTAAALTEYVVENPPAGIVPKIVRDPESVCFGISGLDSVGSWLSEIREIQHSEPACGRNLFPDPSGTGDRSGFCVNDTESSSGPVISDGCFLSCHTVTGCGIDDLAFHRFPAGDFVGIPDFQERDPVDDKSGGIVLRSDGTASVCGTEPQSEDLVSLIFINLQKAPVPDSGFQIDKVRSGRPVVAEFGRNVPVDESQIHINNAQPLAVRIDPELDPVVILQIPSPQVVGDLTASVGGIVWISRGAYGAESRLFPEFHLYRETGKRAGLGDHSLSPAVSLIGVKSVNRQRTVKEAAFNQLIAESLIVAERGLRL